MSLSPNASDDFGNVEESDADKSFANDRRRRDEDVIDLDLDDDEEDEELDREAARKVVDP